MTSEKSSRAGYRNPLRAKVGQQFKFSVFPRHMVITFPPKNESALQPLSKCTGSRVAGGELEARFRRIANTGHGISEEYRAEIFKPFFTPFQWGHEAVNARPSTMKYARPFSP